MWIRHWFRNTEVPEPPFVVCLGIVSPAAMQQQARGVTYMKQQRNHLSSFFRTLHLTPVGAVFDSLKLLGEACAERLGLLENHVDICRRAVPLASDASHGLLRLPRVQASAASRDMKTGLQTAHDCSRCRRYRLG